MVSRQFAPGPGIADEDRAALDVLAQQSKTEGRSRVHALVQLEYIPTEADRDALARQGLILLEYIPNYAWIAAVPADNPTRVAGLPGVRWVGSLAAADKVDASLAVESSPWAYDPATNRAALYVTMHQDVPPEVSEPLLSRYGQVASYAASANLYVLWVDRGQVDALLNEDLVSWVQPAEPKWEPDNNVARARIGSDVLDSATYGNADGTNVDILIYDAGWVRSSHQELTGRVTQRDASCTLQDHSTHVACTTSASGVDAAATGMANNMHAILSDCMSTNTGVFYYTDPGELQSDLVYAKDTWNPAGGDADGAELLNASVGTNTAPNGFPCVWEGNYGPTDVILDNVVRGDTAASGKFIAVWANGNERGNGSCGTTYHTTAPPACGKNPINVGATNKNADTMTSFSSWGPCDDGRIKPVVSAPGCATDASGGIYSCLATNDTAYASDGWCGTSMASPAVAGVVAQLIEYCRAQGLSYCPASGEFWPSSAKALLMQTALDLGNAGPDYQYGYGRIDADATADLITNSPPGNNPDFRQDQITNQGEIDSYQITVSGSPSQLKVSLAWDDGAATMQALKKLVNDLDLEVVSPSATVYRPYILDPNNPANPATTGVDSVNNQEQVVVTSPANGTWTIRVIGKTVPAAPQDYTIVFPNAYTTAPSQTQGATPTPTPTTNPAYCAEYITNGSIESGTTGWTISGSAAQSSTYFHAGTHSMRAGGTANGTFYQDIAVPGDMYFGTISFWYRMQTSETSHPWDFFDVEVRTTANQALTTLLSTDDSKANGVWTQASFTVGPEYAGRSIRLHFSADPDTSIDTYWYVDQVSVNLCRLVSGTPTPTPTPGTPTPTPGASFVYDQTDNSSGTGILSQNFEAVNDAYDSQAADDFLVPVSDGSWTIQNIQIPGQYWAGTGPLASVNVWFYQNSGSLPGTQVFSQLNLVPTSDASGGLVLDLPSPPTLPPGTYWLSVQANMDFDTGGEWGPTTRLVQSYSPWAWRNPGDGFGTGCTAWTTNGSCGFTYGPDLLFRLSGTKGGGGDSDGDTVPDSTDNCPSVYNPGQENTDAALDNGPGVPGDDTTVPNAVADSEGDACETDGDADNDGLPDSQDTNPLGATGICALFNGSNDGHPKPAGGDVTNDDNHNGDPALATGADASDNGPSWDTDNDGALDGVECTLGTNPRERTERPNTAACGGAGDTDGDGLKNAWETCGWGTNLNIVDSDGDGKGDCKEAADVDGNGLVNFVGDTIYYAKAALLPPASFGKTMDFDIDKNGLVDFVGDVMQEARFALITGLCK